MSIHYTLVFVLLILEITFSVVLLLPLPHYVRKGMLHFIQYNPIAGKIQYSLRILFFFIFILFIDALNRAFRNDSESHKLHAHNPTADLQMHSTLFRAQRNMYLCGSVLLLSLLLNRIIILLTQIVRIEEQLEMLKKQSLNNSREYMRLSDEQKGNEDKVKEAEEKIKEAESKTKKAEAMIQQAENLSKEYARLSDEYRKLEEKLGQTEHKKDK